MKNLNIYLKLAFGFAAFGLLLQIGQFVFVLLPLYSLVGSQDTNVSQRLASLETQSKIFTVLLYTVMGIVITLAIIGAIKRSRQVSGKPKVSKQHR